MKLFAECLFPIFALTVCILMQTQISGSARAASEAASLPDVLGRPVKLSAYQPPRGFWEELEKLDTGGLIEKSTFWHPFYSSDVWVFFLEANAEIDLLPTDLQTAISSAGKLSTEGFTRFDLTMTSERRVQLYVVSMSGYVEFSNGEMLCVFANSILEEIGSASGEFERVGFPECVGR